MRRPILVALYALGVLAVGVWSDLAFAGRTDLLRDLLSTAVTLVFGAIIGDTALSVEEVIFARRGLWPAARPLFMLRVMAMGAGWAMLGHLMTPAIAMLAQIPRAGLEILPTIGIGLEFALRRALLPALVVGVVVGSVTGLAFVRRATAHTPV
ncbi:MAG: hypothetical protein RMN52_14405 [Anaerolineae bacterium]|nr:hypothetical protein [Candidatus Roseilinea sp.]MDW8451188.1 hypothetical protein [Anaerolineae bacterium]